MGVFSGLEGWGIWYSFRLWRVEVVSGRIFLNLGVSVVEGTPSNFPFAELYTIMRMDAAADYTMGVWVEVVATVG